jgi:hypothetical protein
MRKAGAHQSRPRWFQGSRQSRTEEKGGDEMTREKSAAVLAFEECCEPEIKPPWVTQQSLQNMCRNSEFRKWYEERLSAAATVKGLSLPQYKRWLRRLHKRACRRWQRAIERGAL